MFEDIGSCQLNVLNQTLSISKRMCMDGTIPTIYNNLNFQVTFIISCIGLFMIGIVLLFSFLMFLRKEFLKSIVGFILSIFFLMYLYLIWFG